MGFSAIAGMIAGTTAVTATAVLGAVATIGLEMSIVGAVTGSKGLMKLGGVMSLVGGVGGMINGAMGAAAGTAAEGLAGEAAGSAFNAAADSQLANVAIDAAGGNALAGYAAAGATPSAVAGLDGLGNWAAAADDAWKELGYSDASGMTDMDLVTKAPSATMPVAETPDAFSFNAAKDAQQANIATDAAKDVAAKTQDGGAAFNAAQDSAAAYKQVATPPKDYFSEFLTWVKQNEKTANMIMQVGGSALSGMNQRAMFDEKMALEKSRNQYGNTVANLYGKQPLIGATQ